MPVSDTACPSAGRPAPSSRPRRSRSVPVSIGGREDRALGLEVAEPGAGPVAGERCVPRGGADLVGPLPSDVDGMVGAVACAQHERRRRDLRRREGAVRRDHRGDVAQRGAELLGEALELARRDPQPLAVEHHPLQRRRRRPDEAHEPQPPALGFVAGAVVAALGAHDAVSAGTEEQQRLQAVSLSSPSTWRTARTSDP